MLIIEGSDLVGKTTLAHTLLKESVLERAGYIYRHFSRLPSGFDYCQAYCAAMMRNSVQDRFHMSQPVYAHVREEFICHCTPEHYRLVDANVRMLGGITVLITADDDLIRDRWRDSEMYDIEKVLRANDLFWEIAYKGIHVSCDMQVYRPDLDLHYHCTPQKPFVTDEEVNNILLVYLARQNALNTIMEGGNNGPAS